MQKKLIVLYAILILIPLGVILGFSIYFLNTDARRVQTEIIDTQKKQLTALSSIIASRLNKVETELALSLTKELDTPGQIRNVIRNNPYIFQIFITDEDESLVFPPKETKSLREREFLERTSFIWDKNINITTSADSDINRETGWYQWYVDDGMHFIYWIKRGTVIGCEVESALLISDLVNLLPDTDIFNRTDPLYKILLVNEQDKPFYIWGQYRPAESELPSFIIPLGEPFNAWSFKSYINESAYNRGLRNFLIIGMLVLFSGALVVLGFFVYRENTRLISQARTRVSFVNQVSHELKTPLTNIQMYSELTRNNLPPHNKKLSGYMNIILSETNRLSNVVKNVLTFARRDKNKLHVSKGAINQAITQILACFDMQFEQNGFEVDIDLRADEPREFDRGVLEQILGNIISNSLKYAQKGRYVSISSYNKDDYTIITVNDRGPGVPPRLREAIFKPFYRIDNSITHGAAGTGIGLSICRELAEKHMGSIACGGKTGAEFVVTLKTRFNEVEDEDTGR